MKIEGQELTITPSSFSEAMALQVAIGKSLKGNKIDLSGLPEDLSSDVTPDKLSGTVGTLANLVLSVGTSQEVTDCLFKCAERAVYGLSKEKVDREFFEKVENRKLYYPIMIEVIKENVGPFFGGVGSLLQGLPGMFTSFLKSK